MTNLDSIFKSRDITLLTKVRLVKAMVFHVVIYGCESWTAPGPQPQFHQLICLQSWGLTLLAHAAKDLSLLQTFLSAPMLLGFCPFFLEANRVKILPSRYL